MTTIIHRLGVIADVRYGAEDGMSGARCSIGGILLDRAVRRMNRLIQPDAVLVLGDLLDDETAAGADERGKELQRFLDKLDAPVVVVPGKRFESATAAAEGRDLPDVVSALRRAGCTLTEGDSSAGTIDVPVLCEAPFRFLEIVLTGDKVEARSHQLAMPPELGLADNHIHTQLAYCSENMTVAKTIELARDFGLAGVTFTEHAGQLYYDTKPYWGNQWLSGGAGGADVKHDRMAQYLELKTAHEDDFARFTLEVECDVRGDLVLKPEHMRYFDDPLGTIHALPGMTREAPPTQRDVDDFLFMVEALGKRGVRTLAHPLRVFRRSGWDTPPELYAATADLLSEHGVAAELNFHTNEPPVEFVRCCLDRGVKFSFGSDSHNLSEIGDFAYQIALLREAGFDGDLRDILVAR